MLSRVIGQLRRLSRIQFIVTCLVCLLLVIASRALIAHARGWLIQTPQNSRPAQIFRIYLRPWGIEPKQALLRHEEVSLVLDDTTGTAPTLVFERRGSGRVAEVGSASKRHQARKFKLPPGDYEFYVAGRPEDRGLLTVLRPNQ